MLTNQEGRSVPEVNFRTRVEGSWQDVTSKELFAGRYVAVFSLPGAFTPTCSSSHVPRYEQLAEEFFAQGVDEIVCVSVNDAFVMDAWREQQKAHSIRFLPDGNGAFTEAMGMLVDKEDLGFGKRSWRYSMLVRDCVVEKMFIESEAPGDPFQVSDADTMLGYLAPDRSQTLDISLLSRPGCEHCVRAKQALQEQGLAFEALELNRDFTDRSLRGLTGQTQLPQVFVNGEKIGGADQLAEWLTTQAA